MSYTTRQEKFTSFTTENIILQNVFILHICLWTESRRDGPISIMAFSKPLFVGHEYPTSRIGGSYLNLIFILWFILM